MPQQAQDGDSTVYYNTYYSLFVKASIQKYVHWKGVNKYVYFYEKAKALWFAPVNTQGIEDDTNTSAILTGQTLKIHILWGGVKEGMAAEGVEKTAQWSLLGPSQWTIWQAVAHNRPLQPNLPVTVGGMYCFRCQDSSYVNTFLVQQQGHSDYVSIDYMDELEPLPFTIVDYSDAIAGDPPEDAGE